MHVNQCEVIVVGGVYRFCYSAEHTKQRPGTKLILLERESEIGCQQTGHNSGVIIYSRLHYKPRSLKAINCQKRYQELIDFCQNENVPHEVCGKVVVATSSEELPRPDELYSRGITNGLDGI